MNEVDYQFFAKMCLEEQQKLIEHTCLIKVQVTQTTIFLKFEQNGFSFSVYCVNI